MNSAAGHTNQVRVRAESKLTKVVFPGNVASNYNPILNAGGCSPVYKTITYFDIIKFCTPPKPGNTMCNTPQ